MKSTCFSVTAARDFVAGARLYRSFMQPITIALFLSCCLPAAAQSIPHSSHVVLVIEENQQITDVQAQMPWLTSKGNQYGYAANYQADTSGSLMDYLWLSSGSCEGGDCSPSAVPPGSGNFGCTGDSCTSPITDDNIFRILNNAGLSWKEYMESYTGWDGPDTNLYVKRHNPAAWYSDVINDPASQAKIVDFGSNFLNDANANSLPNYSIVVPNLLDDAHDGTPGEADTWLQNNIGPILNTPPFQPGGDGLLIITFDECDAAAGGGCSSGLEHIYTAVIGPQVVRNTVSNTLYKHEHTLRTILQAAGVTDFPLASGSVAPMCDFFGTCGGSGGGVQNIDDQTNWTCNGNCSPKAADTSIQQDGASARFTYTGGAAFTDATWRAPAAADYSNAGELSLGFLSYITNPSASQALEVHALQQFNGNFYPFQIQCDFQGSQLWRVWDPVAGGWVPTNVGCVVFTANSWDTFILHFHRSGTQLVYDDVSINGTTYPFNVTVNAIPQSGTNSMNVEVKLIGDGTGTAYSWWLDQLSLTF